MADEDFLQWIHDRLINVHGENENTDYMHRLRKIIQTTATQRRTLDAANSFIGSIGRNVAAYMKAKDVE